MKVNSGKRWRGALGIACLGLCWAAGCASGPERTLYEKACREARSSRDFPPGAVIAPRDQAEFYVGKNTARVNLKLENREATGRVRRRLFTVWFRNMAHDWEVDRSFPTPEFPVPPPGASASVQE